MTERYYYNQRVRNAPIRRRLDRRFLSWVMVAAFVGSIVAFGFVYSARCHFEAVELGYETQQQREELARHEERRRQLELERARTLSPDELERRARRIGLRESEPPSAENKSDKADKKSPKRNARAARAVAP
jgi:hypothetical protein